MVCEDPACGLRTRQLSVAGCVCLQRGCKSTMRPAYDAQALDTQLKYLKSRFDLMHCYQQYKRSLMNKNNASDIVKLSEVKRALSIEDQDLADAVCGKFAEILKKSSYNTIDPSLFSRLFEAAALQ